MLQIGSMDLVIAMLLVSLTLSSTCPTSYTFYSTNMCTFHIDYTDSSCEYFTFDRCNYRYCFRRYSNGTCYRQSSAAYSSSSWSRCVGRCCTQTVYSTQSKSNLKRCRGSRDRGSDGGDVSDSFYTNRYSSSSSGLSTSVYLGIFLPIVGIPLVCFCCVYCYRRLQPDQTGARVQSHQFSQQQAVGSSRALALAQKPLNQQWKIIDSDNPFLKDNCTICLDAEPRLELSCRHTFHRQCIIASMRRKMECILCRRKDVFNVKVHCQSCSRYAYQTDLRSRMEQINSNCQLCPQCLDRAH